MSMTINTNVASLNAQRNLSGSQGALQTSLQRLSSGLRINSAKDDAAGLAISERMGSQIRGLDQARRNANDGISLAQTAEGALGEIGNNLHRIRELSVQSANATNSASDREALQKEVQQLSDEITRIAETTQFNGLNLMDGSFGKQKFQVGSNANQTIEVGMQDARASALGKNTVASQNKILPADYTKSLSIDGLTIDTTGAKSLSDVARAVNAKSDVTGVTASAGSRMEATLNLGTYTPPGAGENSKLTINGVDIGLTSADTDMAAVGTKIQAQIDNGNLKDISFDAATGELTSTGNIQVTMAGAGTGAFDGVAGGAATAVAEKVETIEFSAAMGKNPAIAGDLATALGGLAGPFQATKLSDTDVRTAENSQKMIEVVDAALQQINNQRADLGAVQNRFSSVITTLQSSAENLNASRGRILDADFASETAKMSRNQVLQQAGTAMLAQANQLPQQVLQLLR